MKRRSFFSRACNSAILVGIASAAIFPLSVASSNERTELPEIEHPDFSSVEALIEHRVASGVPSITVGVAQHGKVIWEAAVGVANRQGHIPATVRTPYYLASVSKTITATALMMLASEGKISLDKPVNDYLKEAKLTSPMWDPAEATVRRMATHTAGLTTYNRMCAANDPDCSTDPNDLIRNYGTIVWQPGDHFDYSNADYGILGQVVADASGQAFPTFLREKVFGPLGMSSCFLDGDRVRLRAAAVRYDSSRPNIPLPPVRSTTPGASAMYCSVHDLLLFGMFHLKDDLTTQKKILSDQAIDEMQKSFVATGDDAQYGLGWWIQPNFHGERGILAQGGTSYAAAWLELIPSEDVAIAMVSNTGSADAGKIVDAIASILVPHDQYVTRPAQAASASASNLQAMPTEPMVGAWRGLIYVRGRNIPLSMSISRSGDGAVEIDEEHEPQRVHLQFDKGVVRCDVAGPPGLGDTGTGRYKLDLKLYLHGDTLVGAARSSSPTPFSADKTQLFYGVRLEKERSVE